MAQRTGIYPSRGHENMVLADAGSNVDPGWPTFQDGRDGTDRWGRDRATLIACGTGWDDYVCPAYESEACPGNDNPGDRFAPNLKTNCDLFCGSCGGGYRADTMAWC